GKETSRVPRAKSPGNPAQEDSNAPQDRQRPSINLATVHHLATGAGADGLPNVEANTVGDEMDRAIREADVHAGGVVTAGRDVGSGNRRVAAVIALVIGRDGVRVTPHLRDAPIVLQSAVANNTGRSIIPRVALVGVPLDEGRRIIFRDQ